MFLKKKKFKSTQQIKQVSISPKTHKICHKKVRLTHNQHDNVLVTHRLGSN